MDAYIAKAADFAKPILRHVLSMRALVLNEPSVRPVRARKRRLAQALEWPAAGKSRNWKYQDC